MNWKNRLTNYNFWISIFSAVLLILQALKIEFDIAYVNEIFTAVLGLLVVIGIISDPTRTSVKSSAETVKEKKEKTLEETQKTENKNALPIVQKDEIDNINIQDDFKTILEKISSDLDVKIKEMQTLNAETAEKLVALQTNNKNDIINSKVEEVVEQEIQVTQEEKPAVAEMENPYIDLMN